MVRLLYGIVAILISACATPFLVHGTTVPANVVAKVCYGLERGRSQSDPIWDGKVRWIFSPDGTLLGVECHMWNLVDPAEPMEAQASITSAVAEPLDAYLFTQGWTGGRYGGLEAHGAR
jgi:hypothetical protein